MPSRSGAPNPLKYDLGMHAQVDRLAASNVWSRLEGKRWKSDRTATTTDTAGSIFDGADTGPIDVLAGRGRPFRAFRFGVATDKDRRSWCGDRLRSRVEGQGDHGRGYWPMDSGPERRLDATTPWKPREGFLRDIGGIGKAPRDGVNQGWRPRRGCCVGGCQQGQRKQRRAQGSRAAG